MKTLRHFNHFTIAGFTYYDGALVFSQLQIGTELSLVFEPDNRYDPKAVAIHFGEHKLGFVPRGSNDAIAKLLEMGHQPFACHIQQLDPTAHPEKQVGVVVFVRRAGNLPN
ncbi:MAG TPA: DNA-binding protein [Bacteroidales bacterium]|nr:DNA-binding protein [Bacteroidales bacterium]